VCAPSQARLSALASPNSLIVQASARGFDRGLLVNRGRKKRQDPRAPGHLRADSCQQMNVTDVTSTGPIHGGRATGTCFSRAAGTGSNAGIVLLHCVANAGSAFPNFIAARDMSWAAGCATAGGGEIESDTGTAYQPPRPGLVRPTSRSPQQFLEAKT
jgi:hypothetical protein